MLALVLSRYLLCGEMEVPEAPLQVLCELGNAELLSLIFHHWRLSLTLNILGPPPQLFPLVRLLCQHHFDQLVAFSVAAIAMRVLFSARVHVVYSGFPVLIECRLDLLVEQCLLIAVQDLLFADQRLHLFSSHLLGTEEVLEVFSWWSFTAVASRQSLHLLLYAGKVIRLEETEEYAFVLVHLADHTVFIFALPAVHVNAGVAEKLAFLTRLATCERITSSQANWLG